MADSRVFVSSQDCSIGLAADTPLPTPNGWATAGSVAVGAQIYGADGQLTRVRAATDVVCGRHCVAVEFSDRSVIVTGRAHRWLTATVAARRTAGRAGAVGDRWGCAVVRSADEIAETLTLSRAGGVSYNHAVFNTAPLQAAPVELAVPPYTLGAWLADGIAGGADIVTAEPQILARIAADGIDAQPSAITHEYRLECSDSFAGRKDSTFVECLDVMGVLTNKRIPAMYLRAAESQRRELLAGLLDTNGTVGSHGIVRCSVTSAPLAEDVAELIASLGYRCGRSSTYVGGRPLGPGRSYTNQFSTSDPVFGLARKAATHRARRTTREGSASSRRSIIAVRPVASTLLRAVTVDSPSGLFLAGLAMIPTYGPVIGGVAANRDSKRTPSSAGHSGALQA